MKLRIWSIGIFLLAGCAAPPPYPDFGKATQRSWDSQVAYPDYRYAEKVPSDLAGIHAEEVMGVRNDTFGEAPEQAEIFQLGLSEGSRR